LNPSNNSKKNRTFIEYLICRIRQYFNDKTELKKLVSILVKTDSDEQTVILSLLTNLCSDKNIRLCVVNETELLQILVQHLEQSQNEFQFNLLGLLVNLTNEESSTLEGTYKKVGFILF
jgi:hypothetical protein